MLRIAPSGRAGADAGCADAQAGKDFTQRSPANEDYSQPKKGKQGDDLPLGTSKVEKEKKGE